MVRHMCETRAIVEAQALVRLLEVTLDDLPS
jgi:hypothetical protein